MEVESKEADGLHILYKKLTRNKFLSQMAVVGHRSDLQSAEDSA